MRTRFLPALACAALHSWWAAPAAAQVFTNDQIDRSLRLGAWAPYDGIPYTQRYGYNTGAILYFNGNSRQLYWLDYMDRLDRAERFGYRRPIGPFDHPPPAPCPAPPVTVYPYVR
jgi:hypothetical protein